jgi:hypothetical protein
MVTRKRCGLCMHEDREALEAGLESGQINPDMLDREQDWRSGTSAQHLRNHMGDYQQSSNPRCGLCTDPMRKHYEMALSEGTIDAEAVSQALNVTKQQVHRHMKHHLKPVVQESAASMIAKKEVNEIEILSKNIQRLDMALDGVFAQDEHDPKVIDSLTKLAREVRESLKYLMQFKGEFVNKTEHTVIHKQMEIVQEVLAESDPEVWLRIKERFQKDLA